MPNKNIDISPYLEEIAERLWTGHASVMVGAGFSKNAKDNSFSSKEFPDWSQLGNAFYKKIYGDLPSDRDDKDKYYYLNPLKLANEVQAALGRPALDKLLLNEIPDKTHEPSPLHAQLLNLPWVDVFTTNYDTLLERACTQVIDYRYDIVLNQKDLIYSEKPRIIKLHGSFPSERPFIITEEDYREYPKKFAPFVNTVQQSLLENTLCLIGFSGDDPNFLQWIGWIRDNLGKENAPKIYLIGRFQLSDPQKKLLEDRKIVLVDMENHPEVEQNDHGLALKSFFKYLISKKQITNRLNWPERPNKFLFDGKKEISPQVIKTTEEWKQQRDLFPNWVILPEEKRQSFSRSTINWINVIDFNNEMPDLLDIDFLYELNWRLEICLSPIENHLIKSYEKILDRHSSNTDKNIRNKWLELQLSVLRFYREEHFIDKWNRLDKLITEEYKQQLSPELLAKWNYERCLQALFSFDVSQLNKYLDEWPIVTTLPFWEAKRAGLLAELGQLKKAESILEKSLQTIRSQLNLSPTQNYYWLSRESYVLQLLKYVQQAKSWQERSFSEEGQERYKEYSDRWNILLQHKCDPWGELKLFQLFLNKEPQYKSSIVKKQKFDIGKVSTTHNFISSNEAKVAYAFFRFCEETGILFQIPGSSFAKETMGGAIKRIAYLSPHWALTSLLRVNNVELVDSVFNREYLSKIEVVQVDILISNYLDILQVAIKKLEQNKKSTETNIEQRLIKVLPEILSRLCLKCSAVMRDKILVLLKEVYSSDIIEFFNEIGAFTERVLNSFSSFEQYNKIPELLEFPILEIESDDPFHFLHINRTFEPIEAIKIDHSKVSNLNDFSNIENNKAIRGKSLLRLAKLFELGLLNKKQTLSLSSTLWSQIDEVGFPKNTYFRKFSYIILPHPNKFKPEQLFNEYIKSINIPSSFKSLMAFSVGEETFLISGGNSEFFNEILSINRRTTKISWSEDDVISFVDKLVVWWNKEKKHLKYDNKEVKNEFVNRFNNITEFLSYFILPKLTPDLDESIKHKISLLFQELEENSILCLQAKGAAIHLFPEKMLEIYQSIEYSIASSNEEEANDASWGIFNFLDCISNNNTLEYPDNVLSPVMQSIKWRKLPVLLSSLNVFSGIMDEMPQFIKNVNLDDILYGLNCLLDETLLSNDSSTIEKTERLEIRVATAHLAFYLFCFYEQNQQKTPEIIVHWQKICNSDEEFFEVKNQWERK